MNVYDLRVNTIDGLYIDYIVTADSLEIASSIAKDLFFNQFPDADENIKISLNKVNKDHIIEIINKLRNDN